MQRGVREEGRHDHAACPSYPFSAVRWNCRSYRSDGNW
jgi:hypothetical protein